MNLCLVLLLSSTAYDRLLRSPVSCAHLRVTRMHFLARFSAWDRRRTVSPPGMARQMMVHMWICFFLCNYGYDIAFLLPRCACT